MSALPESASALAAGTAARPSPALGLTFAFCKRHGVLIQKTGEQSAEAVYRAGAQPAAIAEVRRVFGLPLQLRRVDPEAFEQLLRQQF
jgi:general secretion pathway protein E